MLLVRTPSPQATESLIGYVLRVSETNGYSSQSEVFSVAGFPSDRMNRKLEMDIGRLAAVLGKSEHELHHLRYTSKGTSKPTAMLLGQPVSQRCFRLAKPMFCPLCVRERGFIEAIWDCSLVIACPRHHCELVGACQTCGARLGTYRKGLLTCKCGGSLFTPELPSVANEISDLMAVLAAKIIGEPAPVVSTSGLPIAELSAMSLRNMEVVIVALGSLHFMSQRAGRKRPTAQLVTAAAQVLSEWPANFYGLLRRIGEASASKAPLATQFMKRHENVNGALFKKGIPPEEIKFLKEAFVRYAMEKWDGGIARFKNKALDGISIERKWMNRKEIAAHLGIGLPTVTKLQKTGQFAIERDEKKNSSYLFADRSKIGPHIASRGRSLGVINAAKFLGISPPVLKSLRQSGDFEIKRLAIPLASYHEADLKAFTEKLATRSLCLAVDGGPPQKFVTEDLPNGVMSLRYALKNHCFKSVEGSASIVQALLDGRIRAIGMTGESAGGLLMHFKDVLPLILASRNLALGNTLSQADASIRLACDRTVVPNLIASGHLQSVRKTLGTRITEESLAEFSKDYVSLVAIGKEHLVASRALIRMCDLHGFPLLKVPRRNPEHPQSFLSREHETKLRRLAAEYRQRKPSRAK